MTRGGGVLALHLDPDPVVDERRSSSCLRPLAVPVGELVSPPPASEVAAAEPGAVAQVALVPDVVEPLEDDASLISFAAPSAALSAPVWPFPSRSPPSASGRASLIAPIPMASNPTTMQPRHGLPVVPVGRRSLSRRIVLLTAHAFTESSATVRHGQGPVRRGP